jgi:hypothetical protein
MATVYQAWDEMELVPSRELRGSMATHYNSLPVKTHAVAIEDGVPAKPIMGSSRAASTDQI